MAIDFEPTNRFTEALLARANELGLTLNDWATYLKTSYEHTRKIARGISFPSRYVLKELCEYMKLDFDAMSALMVEEKIRTKYGELPKAITGKNPGMDEVERLWELLTPQQRREQTAILETLVRMNREDKVGKKTTI
jgi:hypothetical protein